jgi:hypothetical protein
MTTPATSARETSQPGECYSTVLPNCTAQLYCASLIKVWG